MKNDQHRRGCRKRYGRSRDPDLDVMDQLRAWVREVGLEPFPPTYCVSTSIVRAVGLVGVDTAFFSGTFARTGGLSTAIENGVPEEIVWMQSRHANNPAARCYVEWGSPALLYKTWEAFNL